MNPGTTEFELNLRTNDEHDMYMIEARRHELEQASTNNGKLGYLAAIVLCLDKGHLDDLSGTSFPTDLYFDVCSLLGKGGLNITHRDVLSEGR